MCVCVYIYIDYAIILDVIMDSQFWGQYNKLHFQVIAAAQAGKHNDKRESYGDALIVDPWGTIVGQLPGENFFLSCINSSLVLNAFT